MGDGYLARLASPGRIVPGLAWDGGSKLPHSQMIFAAGDLVLSLWNSVWAALGPMVSLLR
ncbi:MAG: hypothetical protein WAL95_02900 [Candidatus Acidiferrales bacterium]